MLSEAVSRHDGSLFTADFWGQSLHHADSNKSWRPLTSLSFAASLWLSGASSAADVASAAVHFHVHSLLLHAAQSLALGLALASLPRWHNTYFPTLAACLFAVHPVHAESVAGIVGRADILAGLCLTLAATLLVHATAAGAWPSRAAFATCVAATVAASL